MRKLSASLPVLLGTVTLALPALPTTALAQITDAVKIGEHAEDIADYTLDDIYPFIVILVILVFAIAYALAERPGMLQSAGAKIAILAVGAAAAGIAAAIL